MSYIFNWQFRFLVRRAPIHYAYDVYSLDIQKNFRRLPVFANRVTEDSPRGVELALHPKYADLSYSYNEKRASLHVWVAPNVSCI